MPLYDFSLDTLRTYQSDVATPADFDSFWAATLSEARAYPLAATFAPTAPDLKLVEAFDVTYAGFGGHPIRAG